MFLSIQRVAWFIFALANQSPVYWVIYLCLTDDYLKYPNISPYSPFSLAVHLYSTDKNDNEYMQCCYTNDLGSSFPVKRNFFHIICMTMVWNMIRVTPCRQVSNMLQKLHATSFMQLVASFKQVFKAYLHDATSCMKLNLSHATFVAYYSPIYLLWKIICDSVYTVLLCCMRHGSCN
jgi:hypothetical protein